MASGGTAQVAVPDERTWPATPGASRLADLALAGLVAATSAPYLLLGPGFYREDWDSLAAARYDGAWATAGEAVAQRRPFGALAYTAVFPPSLDHPMVGHLVLLALGLVVPLLAFRLLARWVPGPTAFAVAALWVVLPSHSALGHWISAVNIVAALVVGLAGALALVEGQRRGGEGWAGVALLVASTLFYDGTMGWAGLALVAVPWLDGRRVLRPATVVGLAALALRAGWAVVAAGRAERPNEAIDVVAFIGSNFGWGLLAWKPAWSVLLPLVLVGVGLVLWQASPLSSSRRGVAAAPALRRDREGLVVGGVVVLVVGILPLVTTGYGMDFHGVGDRANVVASLGAAAILVGLARCLPWPPGASRAWVVPVLVLGLAALPLRWEQDRAWHDSWVWSQRILDEVAALAAEDEDVLVVAWPPASIDGAQGLTGDGTTAVDVWLGRRGVELHFVDPESATVVPDDAVRLDTEPLRP